MLIPWYVLYSIANVSWILMNFLGAFDVDNLISKLFKEYSCTGICYYLHQNLQVCY